MRLPLLTLCLLPALLIGCSSVRVMPTPTGMDQGGDQGARPAIRGEHARTNDFPPADDDGYRPPARLAVLLPMSGTLAPAAAGVRDGLLAAYYAENRRRPLIKFYDSQGTGAGAQAALAKAIADGAQMIVGPLTREEVSAISGQSDTGLPTIALNRGSRPMSPGGTSFAMLPDDEGVAAANRLVDRGLPTALVFSNRSDNAQRAVSAFREALRKRGGEVLAEISIAADGADLNAKLATLPANTPPPKAVFLAMDAGQARTLAVQLKASALASLPRISTSQILSGGSSRADGELDGIEYPELPWLLNQESGLPEAAGLAKTLPSARGPAQRLFAFGADAWKLTAYFERLYNDPSFSIRGATGQLRIDVSGSVQRTLTWAVMSGGRGRPSYEAVRAADAQQPVH